MQSEDAVSEVVQKDGELCALYRSYQNARKRLSEKVRFRGFWKVKSSEEGKSKRFKGSKGRGGPKQSLASRIASSYCHMQGVLGSLLFHVGSTGEKGHKKMPEKPKEAKMLMSGRPVSPQFFPLRL